MHLFAGNHRTTALESWEWQEGVTPMEINGPYIIVDNQKIAPIERLQGSDAVTEDRSEREAQPFGVVDRVTISREARERAKLPPDPSERTARAPNRLQEKPPAASPQLTYSPHQLR